MCEALLSTTGSPFPSPPRFFPLQGLGRFVHMGSKADHLGSTSDAVVRKARCNVIVVQNHDFSA